MTFPSSTAHFPATELLHSDERRISRICLHLDSLELRFWTAVEQYRSEGLTMLCRKATAKFCHGLSLKLRHGAHDNEGVGIPRYPVLVVARSHVSSDFEVVLLSRGAQINGLHM